MADRRILRLSGSETRDFLQGLVSNDAVGMRVIMGPQVEMGVNDLTFAPPVLMPAGPVSHRQPKDQSGQNTLRDR